MANDLSREEWLYLFRLGLSAGAIFAPSPTELETLNRIFLKTIWFHKYEESLLLPSFTRGDMRVAWFPSRFPRQSVHRAVQRLVSRNVLSMRRTGRARSEYRIRVESAAMLSCLDALYPKQDMLRTLRMKVAEMWSANNWEIPDIKLERAMGTTIEEQVKGVPEKSRDNLKRQHLKKMAAPSDSVKPSWVFQMMKALCSELDIRYIEILPTAKEKAQAMGSARNFLNYCKEAGLSPQQVIADVCTHWHRMQSGNLTTIEGKSIRLPSSVSFMDFFRFRREIMRWLADNKDSTPKYEVEFV